ncbi:CobW family GTP-binding protein [Cucumibacter marinus]|uniref:CobW family GTP-binding protein n=1 Tax=Cucumibacter marinus TaxID=1121252 RepID=UPI000427365E|nr:GTP-binding protein [Cucumibacter marinus]
MTGKTTAAPDPRRPVHILTGFLGSGKTSLLRHWLEQPDFADTAVIINEFGEVGLDQLLVHEVSEDVVLLSSGCVCCTVGDDLVSKLIELDELAASGQIAPFGRVLIETSGLADPAPIATAVMGEARLARLFRLGSIITTIDAVAGATSLKRHVEARHQLALANHVILTKADLVDEGAQAPLKSQIASINGVADISVSNLGHPPPADPLFSAQTSAFDALGELGGNHGGSHGHDHEHSDDVGSFVVEVEGDLDWDGFVDWLELLLAARGDSVLRVKGLLAVSGQPLPVVVQGVQHTVFPPETLPAWPRGERRTQLVFIASHLTRDAIETSLASVRAPRLVPEQA